MAPLRLLCGGVSELQGTQDREIRSLHCIFRVLSSFINGSHPDSNLILGGGWSLSARLRSTQYTSKSLSGSKSWQVRHHRIGYQSKTQDKSIVKLQRKNGLSLSEKKFPFKGNRRGFVMVEM